MNRLKFIVESHIPFIKGVFEQAGVEVAYLDPADIDQAAVADCDAIIVRTRTKCDSRLLGQSRCKAVASATIGLDHVDTQWCEANGISVYNAPGCNAPAVAQYVLSSLACCGVDPAVSTLGVVGAGNVGSIVARWAAGLGYRVMLCDPPRQERESGATDFHSLGELTEVCDAITFHTPLTRHPHDYATYHMADSAFFNSLRRKPVVVNSARGGIVDESALLDAYAERRVSAMVVDCWENEPAINRELLGKATVATPHIAGYSRQGKIRATQQVVDAICRHFNLPRLTADAPEAPAPPEFISEKSLLGSYNPLADTDALRRGATSFESLRNGYALRNEPL